METWSQSGQLLSARAESEWRAGKTMTSLKEARLGTLAGHHSLDPSALWVPYLRPPGLCVNIISIHSHTLNGQVNLDTVVDLGPRAFVRLSSL